MKQYYHLLQKSRLFKNIEPHHLATLLSCLKGTIKSYKRKDIILQQGEKIAQLGFVLEGQLQILKDDALGNRLLVASIYPGHFFGEALYFGEVNESPVTVYSTMDTTILFLDFFSISRLCPKGCLFHQQVINNMLYIIAQKNIMLQNRLDFIGKKTIRLKILSFLKEHSTTNSELIVIPYNREEMANFLCIDRAALSHELAKMKKEGLLDYHKNTFRLFV